MIINGNYQCRHSIILNPASMRELDSFLSTKYETVSYAAELKDKSSVEFLNADEMLDFSNFKENRIVKLNILSRNKDYTEKQDITFEPRYGFFRLLTSSARISYKTENPENKPVISSFYEDFFCRSRSTYWYVHVLSAFSILYIIWGILTVVGIASGFLSYPPDFSNPFTGGDFLSVAFFGIALTIATSLINKLIVALFPPIVYEWGEERNKERIRQQRKSNIVWLVLGAIVALILPWLISFLFR